MTTISGIENVAVIGLGTMGPGIAQTFAMAGYRVTGYDPKEEAIASCRDIVRANFDTFVGRGRLSAAEGVKAAEGVAYASSVSEAVASADLVVESVPENRDIKRAVYEQIDEHAPRGCLIWSNTSTLNVYELLPPRRQDATLIAHWFAPPHIIPLVEVVKGPQTPPERVALTVKLLETMNKLPVVMEKYVPGFVINRLQRILGREILFLLEQGYISPEGLDLAVKASLAPRMMVIGAVQRYDFTGLDLSARNLLDESFFDPPIDNRPAELHSKIEKGHLGVKSGRGFYDYGGRARTDILKDLDSYLLDVLDGVGFCLKKERLV